MTIPSVSGLLQNKKRFGELVRNFPTTLLSLAACTHTSVLTVLNARGPSESVSLITYLRNFHGLTQKLPAYLNAGNTGFAQADFNVVCGDCSSVVTREKLGVAKFTRDAVLDPDNPRHVDVHGKAVYLP